MLHPQDNLAVLGLSRSGTTIVAQVVTEYMAAEYNNFHPRYEGEISNVFRGYFFLGDNTKTETYVNGAYLKTFGFRDGFLQGAKIYENITVNSESLVGEMRRRMNALRMMMNSENKTMFKVHPYSIWKNFRQPIVLQTLSKLNYIHVKRNDKLEHFLSFVIARESGIYHTNNPAQEFPSNIVVTQEHMDLFRDYLSAEKWFLELVNVKAVLEYENIKSNSDILKNLGISYELKNNNFVKRLPYTKSKIEYIINKQEVYDFIQCLT